MICCVCLSSGEGVKLTGKAHQFPEQLKRKDFFGERRGGHAREVTLRGDSRPSFFSLLHFTMIARRRRTRRARCGTIKAYNNTTEGRPRPRKKEKNNGALKRRETTGTDSGKGSGGGVVTSLNGGPLRWIERTKSGRTMNAPALG